VTANHAHNRWHHMDPSVVLLRLVLMLRASDLITDPRLLGRPAVLLLLGVFAVFHTLGHRNVIG